MNKQNISQPNKPVQGSKHIWITIISVIITIVVGSGTYTWQKSNLNSTKQFFRRQIDSLQNQVKELQEKLAIQNQQTQQSAIEQEIVNSQQKAEVKSVQLARKALVNYFNLLNNKQYSEAIKYHGSGYDYLRSWNPSLAKDDYAGLLKSGCEINGLRCLKIKNVLEEQQNSSVEFKFTVQFANDDGTLFKRGPCCGATEKQMPTQTDFEYIVKLIDGHYVVATQPIYAP